MENGNSYIRKLKNGEFVVKNHIILCPKCEDIANFNYHFGAFFCDSCNWSDNTYNQMRMQR